MSEPVNPLFEEEKEFLERKKLEYERALRGDVEQLKEQTVQVGKVALVGAGVVSGVWLLSKAIGGIRRRRKARREADEYGYLPDYDEQHFADADYDGQHFADYDEDDEPWGATDEYFGSDDTGAGHGSVYHTETDSYDESAAGANDLDDNGLSDYPDFPAHSSPQHGDDAETRPFWSEEHSHPTANLPYDDSRRLPEGKEFAEPAATESTEAAATPKQGLGTKLMAFAQSDAGKMLLGQAVSIATALAAKAFKDKLASSQAETAKTSDLADFTETSDGYAHGHPASPQPAAPDAHDATADAPHYREPLA